MAYIIDLGEDSDFEEKLFNFAVTQETLYGRDPDISKPRPIEVREINTDRSREIISEISALADTRPEPSGSVLRGIIRQAQERQEQLENEERLAPQRARYNALRSKQLSLRNQGKDLSVEELDELLDLVNQIHPVVERAVADDDLAYAESKQEIDTIATEIVGDKGIVATHPIKKPERAAIKVIRWVV